MKECRRPRVRQVGASWFSCLFGVVGGLWLCFVGFGNCEPVLWCGGLLHTTFTKTRLSVVATHHAGIRVLS